MMTIRPNGDPITKCTPSCATTERVDVSGESIRLAVRNIATHGDTDVFPFPLENYWFHDEEQDIVDLLTQIDNDFDSWMKSYEVLYAKTLASVGYFGFRAATQIDPLWNAYLLALVVEISPDLEAARIPSIDEIVYSYRFSPSADKATLFDREIGWGLFHQTAVNRAAAFPFVVSTDISDFYGRVSHHRLENALEDAVRLRSGNLVVVHRIKAILSRLSDNASYGLPVGGNAARILAETLLNRTDRLLRTQKITFMRFVDDYVLFANSMEEAHQALVRLSEALLREGLTLSRQKTRVTSQSEFVKSSPFAPPTTAESRTEATTREFLGIRLHFDRYSPTAIDDYEALKRELERFDLPGMLAQELRKSRIDEMVTRQLVKAIRLLGGDIRDAAVISLVDNLHVLYPIFPTVAIVLRALLPDLVPGSAQRSSTLSDSRSRRARTL